MPSALLHSLPAPQGVWATFLLGFPFVVGLDLLGPPSTPRTARIKTVGCIVLALAFSRSLVMFGGKGGGGAASQFLTAYLVELSLSVDNLFIFLLLFRSFNASPAAQRKVLLAGIGGALVLRAAFIGAGLAALHALHWLTYVFGALLVGLGARLCLPEAPHQANAPLPWAARWASAVLPMASPHEAAEAPQRFFVRRAGRLLATPLFVLLVAVEASDVLFAVDSVPAGFAITQNGWILFAANAFAVLGLRAMFTALQDSIAQMRYLRPALALVLMFVGAKMLLASVYDISSTVSLLVIVAVLGTAIAASALANKSSA